MCLPNISDFLNRRSVVSPTLPLDNSRFTLNTSGIAGVFGGDDAVSAMATVHVYENRQWLGWYNSPGSYQIAKRYGLLTKSRFFDGFFPGVHTDPATLFRLDSWKGPKFRAAHSGTIVEVTGHLAALFMKECTSLEGKNVVGERGTKSICLTIANLNHVPGCAIYPQRPNTPSPSIPIFISFSTCAACGLIGDWSSFASILLGIVTNGISCALIGTGKLVFTHPASAKGSPAGDGILGSDNEVVLLKGAEGAVNSITRGRFSLTSSTRSQYRWSSVLFAVQFLIQLLTLRRTCLGRILFVVSLIVSWVYNSRLSSSHEKILRKLLLDVLGNPVLSKYVFSTRTSMVVFALLTLRPEEPRRMLDQLLPNDTRVWRQWKATVVQRLVARERLDFYSSDWELGGFSKNEKLLLKTLYRDAQVAYGEYAANNSPFDRQPLVVF